MDQELVRKTLKYAMASSVTQKRALDALGVYEKEAAEVAPLRARVFEHLCKVGAFNAGERLEAERLMAKQAGVLEILDTVLDRLEESQQRLQREKAASLGNPEPAPLSGREGNDIYGYNDRRSSELSGADRALMRVLESPTR